MDEENDAAEEDTDEPFGDLLEEIDRKQRDDGDDPFDALAEPDGDDVVDEEEVFTDESFDSVDTDELWDDLEEAEGSDDVLDDAGDDHPDIVEEAETHVVPKRSFCQNCEHVSDPPEFRCTHDGTQIVEFVDTGHVRVRDCPIVAERQRDRD